MGGWPGTLLCQWSLVQAIEEVAWPGASDKMGREACQVSLMVVFQTFCILTKVISRVFCTSQRFPVASGLTRLKRSRQAQR